MIQNLVFFLVERSAKAMLEQIVPKLVDDSVTVHYLTFEGKQDLENNLKRKLRLWQAPNSAFVVLRDQDSADCIEVKKRLMKICADAGKHEALVRIACHELESFYLGDLEAIAEAYHISVSRYVRKCQNPDHLNNAAQMLNRMTKGCYQKIDGSRRIASLMHLEGNHSHSFNVLCAGILKNAVD